MGTILLVRKHIRTQIAWENVVARYSAVEQSKRMRILNILPLMFGLVTIGATQTVESPSKDTAIAGTRVSLVPPTGLTAKWDRQRKVVPTEGLNFTFTEKGEIRLAKRIANSLLYTKSGVFPSKAVDDPLFIIGQALSKLDIENKEQFAKSRLSQMATITDVEIEQLSQVTVDNLSGYEIFAKGNDKESGRSMFVYQMVLYEDQSYYIMQGLVSSKHGQTYLPVFQEIARSFRRKK